MGVLHKDLFGNTMQEQQQQPNPIEDRAETESLADVRENLIIVTGFGPFKGHEEVNASWAAVKLLPDELKYDGITYILEKIEVPVTYAAVDEAVRNIWQRKPQLVIHCGVHGSADRVYIEKLAYNNRFSRADFAGNHLPSGIACLENCKEKKNSTVRFCSLDVNRMALTVATQLNNDCLTKISKNVGNYLCGYIYIKSLDINCKRSLFLHVPPVDKPLSSVQVADIIYRITEDCIKQIIECGCEFEQSVDDKSTK